MLYEVKANGVTWELRKETILRYVPGMLEYPRHRSRRHFGFPRRATIDISRIVTGNAIVRHGMLPPEQYIYCLKELMDCIEETERDSLAAQNPLLKVLEIAWDERRGDPSRMLPYFVCFADLVQRPLLGGSPELQMALSSFFIQHAERISRPLPLSQSLQYVDMCATPDFPDSMEALLEYLPSRLRRELEDRGGKVRLYITQRPSEGIQQYVRRIVPPGNSGHPRGFHATSPRGRHRRIGRPSSSSGPVARSISAERLLEQNVDMLDVAERGGRIIIPKRGQGSPSQGPSRRHRH